MKLTEKTERWSMGNKRFIGRKNNYNIEICYSTRSLSGGKFWYYMLNKGDFAYNSLWDEIKFETKEDCINSCEQKIDELIKNN